jgi:hypothetical protein
MLRTRASVLSLLCILGAVPSLGQSGAQAPSAQPAEADTASPDITCAGPVVYWAGSGPEVHVIRRGIIDQRSPLAPRADASAATVLDVRIRGKSASAYGPSFEKMRRAGPPQELEKEFGTAIKWGANLASLPREILLVANDGAEVVAKLRFVKCLPPPKARPARVQPAKPRPTEAPPTAKQRLPAAPVPQGAIQ